MTIHSIYLLRKLKDAQNHPTDAVYVSTFPYVLQTAQTDMGHRKQIPLCDWFASRHLQFALEDLQSSGLITRSRRYSFDGVDAYEITSKGHFFRQSILSSLLHFFMHSIVTPILVTVFTTLVLHHFSI
ncbi:MAG: hypothetical protein MJ074_06665 [Oscillospiraceae bacterium]|nr:hypothetical protein [Oscillospiraceae bacterium]